MDANEILTMAMRVSRMDLSPELNETQDCFVFLP